MTSSELTPSDLTGCRYRAVLRRSPIAENRNQLRHPEKWERFTEQFERRITTHRRLAYITQLLPERPRIGDKTQPTRYDVTRDGTANAVENTLEAIANGVRLILNPALSSGNVAANPDILVRMDPGNGPSPQPRYAPIVITGRTIAHPTGPHISKAPRGSAQRGGKGQCSAVSVSALGLGTPSPAKLRYKLGSAESQRLGLSHLILRDYGIADPLVAVIGDIPDWKPHALFFPADALRRRLSIALSAPTPAQPIRIKECNSCEFHDHCRAQLLETLDISLLLPGQEGRRWRERGITTLPQLAVEPQAGETGALARAWLAGQPALRRPRQQWISDPELWGGQQFRFTAPNGTPKQQPRWAESGVGEDGVGEEGKNRAPDLPMVAEMANVVEIDVDMEAHPSRGTFLWGAFDGVRYLAFSDFSAAGDQGRHVAEFWGYLQQERRKAQAAGKKFVVWAYGAQGENHWLRHYARIHGGQEYPVRSDSGVSGVAGERAATVRMPTLEQMEEFLNSPDWCDVFPHVQRAVAGTGSLGLKTIAPLAGFSFSQHGVDGRAAVGLFEQAISPARSVALTAQRTLERYNADDCVASRRVRQWLRRGAPGIPPVEALLNQAEHGTQKYGGDRMPPRRCSEPLARNY